MTPTLDDFRANPQMMFDFMDFAFKFRPHEYQKKFLIKCLLKNKIAGKWCRQSGKSTTVAAYIGFRCIIHPTGVMITAPGLSQSGELYLKIKNFVMQSDLAKKMVERDTQTEMQFRNGSRIKALPTGAEGKSIRGFTADVVIEEEAGLIGDDINNSVIMPLLASKKEHGQVIKIGTPWKKNHFYRSCFIDPTFDVVNVRWEDCVNEGQYNREWLEEQKKMITEIQFRTEYEADFIDELSQYFPLSLIEKSMEKYELLKTI